FDWTNIVFFYFTILPVLVIGTNFRPSIAFILSSSGIIIDELVFCLLHGYGGELWIQLILSLSSLVGTTLIISLICERNTLLAFFLGFFWYIIGFYIPAYFYYCELFYYDAFGLFFYIIAHALVSFVFIPVVLFFNKSFQKISQKQDLESILFLDMPVKEARIS
ncbi:MAG: hypothetical protein ACFFDT_40190, partial [Candidatus Hodarchaeota archaeon]